MQRFLQASFAALICAGAVLSGCQPRYGGETNAALEIPPAGSVRVVPAPVESGADRMRAGWSFIGAINWRTPAADSAGFSLAGTYPLNGSERGGCNVYEVYLVADRASGKWTATLHGSDGKTVTTSGALPAGKSVSDAVQLARNAPSTTLPLPADITLVTIDGKPLRVHLAR